jgi:hypothetical protein
MFPVANSIVVIAVTIGVLTGAIVGTVSGLVLSGLFQLGRRGIWKDSLLGAAGYSAGWMIFFLLLRRSDHVPSPLLLSYGLAVLIPAFRQVYRRSQSRPATGPETGT